MAEKLKLEVIFEADKARSNVRKMNKELEKSEKQTKKTAKQTKGMQVSLSSMAVAAGAVTAGLLSIKKTMDFGKFGAEVDFAEQKFGRLAERFGTTADLLETRLRMETRGLVDDFGLLRQAGEFMSLGLVKTEDQLARLIKVSSQLNFDMNELALTLSNRTTMRFDQLGVAVVGFNEKVQALEAQGLSAADAFLEAFLEQAEQQLEVVGSVADEQLGAFERLEAQGATAWQNLAKDIADATTPLANFTANLLELTNEHRRQNDATVRGGFILDEYERSQRRSNITVKEGWQALQRMAVTGAKVNQSEFYRDQDKRARVIGAEVMRLEGLGAHYNAVEDAVDGATGSVRDFTKANIAGGALDDFFDAIRDPESDMGEIITQDEIEAGQALAEAAGLTKEDWRTTARLANAALGDAENLGSFLLSMDGQEIDMEINLSLSGPGAALLENQPVGSPGTAPAPTPDTPRNFGEQHGGWLRVPGSGMGDRAFGMMLEPGELVNIVPRNVTNNENNLTINNQISNGVDADSLVDAIGRAFRRA